MDLKTAKDLPAGAVVVKGDMEFVKHTRTGLPWTADGVNWHPDGLIDDLLADGATLMRVPVGQACTDKNRVP
jgi:hypothetical protein